MKTIVIRRVASCLALVLIGISPARADAVIQWNENAAKAAAAACLIASGNGLAESRMYAIAHVAIHDAVNAIDRRSRPYAFDAMAGGPASMDAAVAAAARDALVSVIAELPESASCVANGVAETNAMYAAALAAVPDGPAKSRGVALGQAAAAAILALRDDDGTDAPLVDVNYPQGTEPGEWRFTPDFPLQLAFAPNWGKVTPFVLQQSSQFRPGAPYHLGSNKYAADYNEIKVLGGDDITTPSARTADQTQIGLFWIESSPLAWNRLARALAASRGLDIGENARLFGLLNLAMADGYIASWEAKYHYRFWRPITAIRLGDTDGNPATAGDPGWTPLQPTYPMPDHDSGHAVQGGVAAEILKQVFGTDDVPFTICSTTVGAGSTCADPAPVLRSYASFSQAADENAVSRIYIGIHFRNAVEEGVRHGRKIAAYAVHTLLKPVR
jgi:PAP2 superfamily